jgi:hypothetical protein
MTGESIIGWILARCLLSEWGGRMESTRLNKPCLYSAQLISCMRPLVTASGSWFVSLFEITTALPFICECGLGRRFGHRQFEQSLRTPPKLRDYEMLSDDNAAQFHKTKL